MPTLQGERQHTILQKFPQKLHEIERIWTPRRGRASKILLCRSATALLSNTQCDAFGLSVFNIILKALLLSFCSFLRFYFMIFSFYDFKHAMKPLI